MHTFSPDAIGYSLVRFSTKKQADGDSYRRQTDAIERAARDDGVPLDDLLHESEIRKLGMTGLTGEHIIKGPLSKFFAGIAAGSVKRGHVLYVSEWNRLTRQIPIGEDEANPGALDLVMRLLRAGIGIRDVQDNSYYTLDRYNSDVGLQLGLQLKISMAYQYSANLRHNLNSAWEGRRAKIAAGNGKATNASAAWLSAKDGVWEHTYMRGDQLWAGPGTDKRNAQRFEAIEIVKRLRFDKHGKHYIATYLNTVAKLPSFRGSTWYGSAVQRLVKNEVLRGVYQAHDREGNAMGDAEYGYYPRVMSDDDWFRMQWPIGENQTAGKKTDTLHNLFRGLCRCPHCNAGFAYVDKGRGDHFLQCGKSRQRGCKNGYHHDYPTLESEFFAAMQVLDFSRFIERANPSADRIAGLRAQIAETEATIESMAEGFGSNAPPAFFQRAQRLQAENDAARLELEQLEREAKIAEANATSDTYGEFMAQLAAMESAKGQELYEMRVKLANHIRRMVESVSGDGTELVMRLRSMPGRTLEIVFNRAVLQGLRADHLWFPADLYIRRPDMLVPALLAHYQAKAA